MVRDIIDKKYCLIDITYTILFILSATQYLKSPSFNQYLVSYLIYDDDFI